jgi:hypothetical protein
MFATLTQPSPPGLIQQRPGKSRTAVIAAVKGHRATHHAHKRKHNEKRHPSRRETALDEEADEVCHPKREGRLVQMMNRVKSWLYAWTETGYEPL